MKCISQIGIVVPARNEETLLPACLDALAAAAGQIAVPVSIVVVLDDCTDGSADVIASFRSGTGAGDVRILEIRSRCVGTARRLGMAHLLDRLGSEGTWLATTDADSVVPVNWLAIQIEHARAGAEVVVGTVTVADWRERPDHIRVRANAEYQARPHRHVHGANLSFSAAAYEATAGLPDLQVHEDVSLVAAFEANGEAIAWALDLAVVTSARRSARAPRGFASYLTALESGVRR